MPEQKTICDVCGRPVRVKPGRGVPKTRHRNCVCLVSAANDVERRVESTIWGHPSYIAKIRKRQFQTIANCFNQPNRLLFLPHTDIECEDIPHTMKAQYKCRLCGNSFVNAEVGPKPLEILLATVKRACGYSVASSQRLDMQVIHNCNADNVCFGVADLVGLVPPVEGTFELPEAKEQS